MTSKKKYTTWNSLPEYLTAKQLADFLGISRKKIYQLFQTPSVYGGIRSFKMGATNKVNKDDLINWILNKKKEKARELKTTS